MQDDLGPRPLVSRILRGVGSVLLIGLGFLLLGAAVRIGSQGFAVGASLVAVGLFFFGALLSLDTLLAVTLRPIQGLFDSVFGLGARAGMPPLDFRMADYNVRLRRWQVAHDAYLHLVHHHPASLRAHLGAIHTATRLGAPADYLEKLARAARAAADPANPGDAVTLASVLAGAPPPGHEPD